MKTTLARSPIINTPALERLQVLVEQVAETAEMAIVKGPAGIGKSFAINHLRETTKSCKIYTATARPEIAGRINGMASEILKPYGVYQPRMADCMEVVWNLIASRPFSGYSTRSVLIIDEAQSLLVPVLEGLRGLWDMGDDARLFGGHQLAFGLILVGNDMFLSRAGGLKKAAYEPLMTRVQYRLDLKRPTRADLEAFVKELPHVDHEIRAELVEIGMRRGSIRPVAKAWRSVVNLSDESGANLTLLKTVSNLMGDA